MMGDGLDKTMDAQKIVPVSSKGQVVIPAPLRKKFKIGRAVVIKDEGGRILVVPSLSMEDSFGAGGDDMKDVAREISRDRRREVESQRS
jgi:AbrB family looped-hinge helix DNA binding protein